ncbi:right-handed parallel beta-helix repeat-containing protein, partial [Bacteroides cellulosilyticus]|nr:right-handed parallel beta-helix repeat-containing protein [Bacteroides cellulosilyticus]
MERLKDIQIRAGDSLLFRRGSVFIGILELSAKGKAEKRVIIDAYGIGRKPCIKAADASLYTILLRISDYLTLQYLVVVNTGTERLAHRTGVKVLCENYG